MNEHWVYLYPRPRSDEEASLVGRFATQEEAIAWGKEHNNGRDWHYVWDVVAPADWSEYS